MLQCWTTFHSTKSDRAYLPAVTVTVQAEDQARPLCPNVASLDIRGISQKNTSWCPAVAKPPPCRHPSLPRHSELPSFLRLRLRGGTVPLYSKRTMSSWSQSVAQRSDQCSCRGISMLNRVCLVIRGNLSPLTEICIENTNSIRFVNCPELLSCSADLYLLCLIWNFKIFKPDLKHPFQSWEIKIIA